ncbi:phosphoribosylglycinamide formyltransferase [Marinobacter sp. X15-166B]|uniref:phosphoribosylglycinamide formyltransferase n=1 Tax=Marinobacter sp. X15-166B TaxID=1897620 RepID=UPI00085C5F55|nr:phosphoribosylglycinamide formyltransferase [Marinobacter sp. X15-166B]OEY67797.1 phosphoribosylglycinamide formyltransferase [Marinobacter sp. X15-166B]
MIAPDMTEPRIVVLVSGAGTNLQALIDAARDPAFPGKIVAVGSNRPDAFALERARQAGIETFTVDHQAHDSRDAFDTVLKAHIERYSPDALVLAGFMRILTPAFVRAFHGITLNVHPSLLPKYTGLNTHQRVLEAGDRLHGVSIHFVTEDLDGGPVVAQAEVAVTADDTADSLADKVQQKEHLLYPIVLRWFCEGRLKMVGDTVSFDGVPLADPMRLSAGD